MTEMQRQGDTRPGRNCCCNTWGESGQMWNIKNIVRVDVWLDWIGALLILDSGRKDEILIPNSGGRFLIVEMGCLKQCGYKVFVALARGRNSGFFIKVAVRKSNSLWAYT